MAAVCVIVILLLIGLIMRGIIHIFYRVDDKVSDAIRNAVDKKRGKMEESESESLADRFKNN